MYCKLCLTTNLRPNSKFIDGVCEPCIFSISSVNVDYHKRVEKLVEKIRVALEFAPKDRTYDCIVGVSGGKDSTRQAIWIRDYLKLKPLLVCCSYPPSQMIQKGPENLSNLIELGFDVEVHNPSPTTARTLSKQAFFRFGNVCKASEIALFTSVPQIAISKKIPISFFGENPALQEGDSKTLGLDEFDANNLRNLNTLSDGGLEWILARTDEQRAKAYLYPDVDAFTEAKLSLMYLGPAWSDWDMQENAVYSILNGLHPRPFEELETGDITNASMLDEEFTNINMMIKYYKFGFGRATDLCNELIRINKMTRTEAITLVEKYDGVCSAEIIENYCSWIGISVTEFWKVIWKYANKDLFIQSNYRPKPLFKVGEL